MRPRRSFGSGVLFSLSGSASLALAGGYIFEDRMPSVTAGGYLAVGVAFILASIAGSRLAWHLRLPHPLEPVSALVIWGVFGAVLPALAFLPIAMAASWGLWVFCGWAAIGSYAFGFMWFNVPARMQDAG